MIWRTNIWNTFPFLLLRPSFRTQCDKSCEILIKALVFSYFCYRKETTCSMYRITVSKQLFNKSRHISNLRPEPKMLHRQQRSDRSRHLRGRRPRWGRNCGRTRRRGRRSEQPVVEKAENFKVTKLPLNNDATMLWSELFCFVIWRTFGRRFKNVWNAVVT